MHTRPHTCTDAYVCVLCMTYIYKRRSPHSEYTLMNTEGNTLSSRQHTLKPWKGRRKGMRSSCKLLPAHHGGPPVRPTLQTTAPAVPTCQGVGPHSRLVLGGQSAQTARFPPTPRPDVKSKLLGYLDTWKLP